MRYMLPLLFLLWACSDEGAVRQDQKVLPNEDPTTYYKTVPQTDLASTNVIKQRLAETRPLAIPIPPSTKSESDEALPAPQKTADDLRTLPKEERLARLRQVREGLTGAKPKPGYSPPIRERDPLTLPKRNRSARPHDAQASKPKEQKQPKPANRPHGGALFAVDRAKADGVLKPGELFRAKLIGRVDVSSLSPFVLAEVFDPDGRPLGRAIGRASLHPVEKTKALLTFSQLILADGTVDGRLVGLDMELGQGLRGRLHKGNFRKILLAFTNTLLAALSLEVDTGDSFAEVFKFNLTKNLFDQAQGQLAGLDTARVVTLDRHTEFWLLAEAPLSVKQRPFAENPAITTAVERAFDQASKSSQFARDQNRQLMDAYQRLNQQLDQLP